MSVRYAKGMQNMTRGVKYMARGFAIYYRHPHALYAGCKIWHYTVAFLFGSEEFFYHKDIESLF